MKLILPAKDTVKFLIIVFAILIFFQFLFGFILVLKGFSGWSSDLPLIIFENDYPIEYRFYLISESLLVVILVPLYLIIKKYGEVIKWGKQKEEPDRIPIDRKRQALSRKRKWWFW